MNPRKIPPSDADGAAHWRLIADCLPLQIAYLDREQRYRFVNRPYAAPHRLEPQELIGRTMREVIGDGTYELARAKIAAAFAGERQEFELETDLPPPQVGKGWSQVTYLPERAADGRVVGLVAAFLDITAHKQIERELAAARDQARATSRAKDEFLAAVTHELRTSLSPVLLLASDAAANAALPAGVRADFDAIRKNVDVEARIIDDLLDLTRVTRGQLPLDLRTVNLHTALREALALVQPALDAKHLVLAVDLVADEPTVWGDRARLHQAFGNVLQNAVKFTPEFGRIAVHTESDAAGGVIIVRISDTGVGFTADEQARLFDSSARSKPATAGEAQRFGGLGLGLAISRMLVEMHSGHLRASSAGRGRGAEFSIELPLRHAVVRRAGSGLPWPLRSAPLLVPEKPSPTRRVRVLLVEDHAPTRNTLAQLLGRRHYEVLAAASVAEARAFGTNDNFQLLISDIGLPDGDGYELMAELRAQRPDLPGIAITGYGMHDDFARSRQAGFAQHLVKPVNIAALETAIASLLPPPVDPAVAKN